MDLLGVNTIMVMGPVPMIVRADILKMSDRQNDRVTRGATIPDHNAVIGIVEDENEIVKVLKKLFMRHHLEIGFVASDGDEAVDKIRMGTKKPRVLLMDNRLNRMNGIEAMGEILKIDPGIRIIFLSADREAEKEALKAGAWKFLRKPASIHDIMAAVNSALS